jgi:hypothetical protein
MRASLSVSIAWLALAVAGAPEARAAGSSHLALRQVQDARAAADEGPDDGDDESDDEAPDEVPIFVERFEDDPTLEDGLAVSGQPLDRLAWTLDEPAWPGDSSGSLTASYVANAPAGLFGFPLPAVYTETEAFTAAAAFVIRSEGFHAAPDAFFQISWGLWSTTATGLNRTGSSSDPAADTFELVAFDWFPNAAFGGPFLSPIVFGEADTLDPGFPFSGAFANFTTVFDLAVDLPRDVPLLAVLEHRPELDALAMQVFRIVSSEAALPLDGAAAVVPLAGLAPRRYALDAVGLMLWNDGFGGPSPAVVADVTYHGLVVAPGVTRRAEEWLHVAE